MEKTTGTSTEKSTTSNLGALPTEGRNPASEQIDRLPTLEMLQVINREDQTVALAVERELANIARAVDEIAARFERGGRLFYIGAGTSGRLGVLDASECPPATLVQGLIAGGDDALRRSSEHSEDSPAEGAADLAPHDLGPNDTVVGIAASGRTPYVLGALDFAQSRGALTIALTCVPDSAMARVAEIAITPVTGPEILTGSTRMKAGTATKLVLNMLSTGVMIRTGAVYSNLMVNMRPTNEKLVDRAQRILMAATGCDKPTAAALLETAGSVKTGIVMQRLGVDQPAAEARLNAAHGRLRVALDGK
jgi:N-acetylmuramic acid 6-phosphate etherase